MYESSGSQFFRTTIGIQSGLDAFDESTFVMIFLAILGVMEILYSFKLVLEGKTDKEIPESSRLELLEKFLVNNFASSYAENHTSGSLNRGGITDLPLLRTLLVPRAKFLGSDGIFCFSSIWKFGSFKNPFASITSLSELYFRFRRFILLVQTKNEISMNYGNSTSC